MGFKPLADITLYLNVHKFEGVQPAGLPREGKVRGRGRRARGFHVDQSRR